MQMFMGIPYDQESLDRRKKSGLSDLEIRHTFLYILWENQCTQRFGPIPDTIPYPYSRPFRMYDRFDYQLCSLGIPQVRNCGLRSGGGVADSTGNRDQVKFNITPRLELNSNT